MNEDFAPPLGSKWTKDQWQAIVDGGQSLLVSAAAGSGKTAVLVERIIQKVTNDEYPIDIDRMLVVTFTNAAAAEMKSRVASALEKELIKQPSSLHLRRQLLLVNRASISTLHAFCMKLVRQYHHITDIDPAFRIGDPTEMEFLQEEALEELLETEYGQEDNQAFFDLVDRYSADRHDIDVAQYIKRLYEFSRAHPWPFHWLQSLQEMYQHEGEGTIDDSMYGQVVLDAVQVKANSWEALLKEACLICGQDGGPASYLNQLETEVATIQAFNNACQHSWNKAAEISANSPFTRLPSIRKNDGVDEELKTAVTNIRNKIKKDWNDVYTTYFARKPDSYLDDLLKLAPVVGEFKRLVIKFHQRYEAKKQQRGVVDFSDLEHAALAILRAPESTPGKVIPSEAACSLSEFFEEVMVDEYQDTNLVQEALIELVSRQAQEKGNRFMVGDVKQSIYRFRLAEPTLFTEKYRLFSTEQGGKKIDLAMNFRSRASVLEATNVVFRQLMDEKVAGIAYDSSAELVAGLRGTYTENNHFSPELLVIDGADQAENVHIEDEETDKAVFEGRLIAQKIKSWVSRPDLYAVYDKDSDQSRPAQYRDIVILLRSMPWASAIMDTLREEGIPVYAELGGGYFDATEVSVMLSLLQIIDNPYQDIPLAGVLRSPIVGLDEELLANIRLVDRKSSFFEAVETYVSEGSDHALVTTLQLFLGRLKKWRKRATSLSVADLIYELYRDTGYIDFVGGLPGGKQRQANLRALYDRAKQYEDTSFRGLFRFLRFIEWMQERGDDLGVARALGEQEDVVRIMTIHKSKGLEFPFVLLAGLGRSFNRQDVKGKLLLHQHLGLGTQMIRPESRYRYPTLAQLAIIEQLKKEQIAEEMRVLYVAMTRAREKLCMIGTLNNAEKTIQAYELSAAMRHDGRLPEAVRVDAKAYIDWLYPALLPDQANEDPVVSVEVIPQSSLLKGKSSSAEKPFAFDTVQQGHAVEVDDVMSATVEARLTWKYGKLHLTKAKAKQTVTELKRKMDLTDEHMFDYDQMPMLQVPSVRSSSMERPRFMQDKQSSLTPAERGTALHAALQRINWQSIHTVSDVAKELEALVHKKQLTPEQRESLDAEKLFPFFEHPVIERIQRAKRVFEKFLSPMVFQLNSSASGMTKIRS
ncbi:helicase-exonuclease AddAB subunit AddA [Litoribacterium kuwaitense]|uniref:helicase-exonuclease AddAB subunit AddA n=1 Tax=Litoribacterium kuwaitense TaxID=1398745 RepID=UPI001FE4753D|nr:helicase-exonuclease AddAB subunit AddA [Litoribacterium kuwaitense]